MGDYRYDFPRDLWVQDDHIVAGRDMPDELIPDDPELVDVRLIRDDDWQPIGAEKWETTWHPPMALPEEACAFPGRWVPFL